MIDSGDLQSIRRLPSDIWLRLKSPIWSVTFWMHLLVAVILAGGAGLWYTLVQFRLSNNTDMIALASALCTYFPAVVGSAFVDIDKEKQLYWRSFGVLAVGIFVVIFVFAALDVQSGSISFGLIGSVLSIAFWWIANGERDCFKDVHPEAPTPPPNQELRGNTHGWKT